MSVLKRFRTRRYASSTATLVVLGLILLGSWTVDAQAAVPNPSAAVKSALQANPQGGEGLTAAIDNILGGYSGSEAVEMVNAILAAVNAAGSVSSGAWAAIGTAIGAKAQQLNAAQPAAAAAIARAVQKSAQGASSSAGASLTSAFQTNSPTSPSSLPTVSGNTGDSIFTPDASEAE